MATVVLTSSNAAWAWPNGVTSAVFELIGGGGAGGNATNNAAVCGGGKGGSYVKKTITKGAESTLNITVGGAGQASTVVQGGTTVASAAGGASVAANATAGASALVGSNIGDTVNAGGNGGSVSGGNSGAGGGAGGPTGAGGTPTAGTGSFADGNTYSGAGAAAITGNSAGGTGSNYGGGGSGGKTANNTDRLGGAGAPGVVVITYSLPAATFTENFSAALDTNKWTLSPGNGTTTVSNGFLETRPPTDSTGYSWVWWKETTPYNLTGSESVVKLAAACPFTGSGGETIFEVWNVDNSGQWLRFIVVSGLNDIQAVYHTGTDSTVLQSLSYSSSTYAWLRVRESSGTCYFDTAPSTASNPPASGDWTNFASVSIATLGWTPNKIACSYGAGGFAGNSGPAQWDGVNTAATLPNPGIDTFTDNFTGTLDTAKWSAWNNTGAPAPVNNNGVLEIGAATAGTAAWAGVDSVGTYNLVGKRVFVRVPNTLQGFSGVGGETSLYLFANGTAQDSIRWILKTDGGMDIGYTNGGSWTWVAGGTYSATDHAWISMRESGGTIYLDRAPVTASNPPAPGDWVNQTSFASSNLTWAANLGAVKAQLLVGHNASPTGTQTAPGRFDGFNTAANSSTTNTNSDAQPATYSATVVAAKDHITSSASPATYSSTPAANTDATVTQSAGNVNDFSDNFNDGTITGWTLENTTVNRTITESNGNLELSWGGSTAATADTDMLIARTTAAYTMSAGSRIYGKLANKTTTQSGQQWTTGDYFGFMRSQDRLRRYFFHIEDTNLNIRYTTDGTGGADLANLTYSATDHAWWSIRFDGTQIIFETAPNNGNVPGTWTVRHTETASQIGTITSVHPFVSTLVWNTAGLPITAPARWDAINTFSGTGAVNTNSAADPTSYATTGVDATSTITTAPQAGQSVADPATFTLNAVSAASMRAVGSVGLPTTYGHTPTATTATTGRVSVATPTTYTTAGVATTDTTTTIEPFSALVDDFTTLDLTEKWEEDTVGANTTVSIVDGQLNLMPAAVVGTVAFIRSRKFYKLTDSEVYIRQTMRPTGSGAGLLARLRITPESGDHHIEWLQESNGDYAVRVRNSGVNTDTWIGNSTSIPTSSTYAWWRIKKVGGTVYFHTATSSSGDPPTEAQWTQRHSTATITGNYDKAKVQLGLEYWNATAGTPTQGFRIHSINGPTTGSQTASNVSAAMPATYAMVAAPTGSEGGRPRLGVNIHSGGDSTTENTQIADYLAARNLHHKVRFDMYYSASTSRKALVRDLVTKLNARGGSAVLIIFTQYQDDYNPVGKNLSTVYTTSYNQTYSIVNEFSDIVLDYEMHNEVQNRTDIKADLTWNSQQENTANYEASDAAAYIKAFLRGQSNAIAQVATDTGRPLRRIMGFMGRDWGLGTYLLQTTTPTGSPGAVNWDVTGWHCYVTNGTTVLSQDTWWAEATGQTALQRMAQWGKPVTINEWNAGEIYDGDYANAPNDAKTETGFQSNAKHTRDLMNQTQCRLESITVYEAFDEPSKSGAEARFGLFYGTDVTATPKTSLYVFTAFAGGTLSQAERDVLTSKNLLTASEIDSYKGTTQTGGETFSDNFNDGVVGSQWVLENTTASRTITETGGNLVFTWGSATASAADTEMLIARSSATYNFDDGTRIYGRLSNGVGLQSGFEWGGGDYFGLMRSQDRLDRYFWYKQAGNLYARWTTDGTGGNDLATFTYNATDHAWWGIRISGTSIIFETAPMVGNAPGTWVTRHTETASQIGTISTIHPFVAHLVWNVSALPITAPARWDAINTVAGSVATDVLSDAGATSYALVPSATSTDRGSRALPGSFSYTGTTSGSSRAVESAATATSYSLVGVATVGSIQSQGASIATATSFAMVGADAAAIIAKLSAANPATFTTTGAPATSGVTTGGTSDAAATTFAATAFAATSFATRSSTASPAAYSYTAAAATSTAVTTNQYASVAEPAQYAISIIPWPTTDSTTGTEEVIEIPVTEPTYPEQLTDEEFTAWLSAPTAIRLVLLECQSLDANGNTRTAYFANRGYVSGPFDTVRNQVYEPYLRGGLDFQSRLTLELGGGQSYGNIELDNTDGSLDWMLKNFWQYQPVRAYIGDARWSRDNFRLIFDGTCEDIDSSMRDRINVRLRDKLYRLEMPLHDQKIGGASAESDKLLPAAFGECHNVTPVLIDANALRYCYHVRSAEGAFEVRDNGIPIQRNSDAPGTFVLLRQPAGRITCSVQGDSAGGYANRVASILYRLLTIWGTEPEKRFNDGDIDLDNFDQFFAEFTAPVGMYTTERMTVWQACQAIASSIGARLTATTLGKARLVQLTVPPMGTPIEVTPSDMVGGSLSIKERPRLQPSVKLGYAKNWTVQQDTAAGLPEEHKRLFGQEWLTTTLVNTDVKALTRLWGEPEQEDTYLLRRVDADVEALRRVRLRSAQRHVFEFTGFADLVFTQVGSPMRITHPRFDLENGKIGQVIGVSVDWVHALVTIEVLI